MLRGLTTVVVLLLLLVRAAPAKAQAQENEPFNRTSAVYLLSGLGAPTGFFGLEAVHRFGPTVELAAGLGDGLAATLAKNGSPLQWALMPRVRIGDAVGLNLTVGAGISGGNYADVNVVDCDNSCNPPVYNMLWANFEIGVESWSRSGFARRFFVGWAQGLLTGPPSSAGGFPYLGGGMGYAF